MWWEIRADSRLAPSQCICLFKFGTIKQECWGKIIPGLAENVMTLIFVAKGPIDKKSTVLDTELVPNQCQRSMKTMCFIFSNTDIFWLFWSKEWMINVYGYCRNTFTFISFGMRLINTWIFQIWGFVKKNDHHMVHKFWKIYFHELKSINSQAFLSATKQLYEWFSPSVCPSVTPFWLCSHHHEIFRSNYQWQKWCPCKRSRSKVKVTEVMTPFSRFRTVTPVWIHIFRWNYAYSLMLLRRGALLFFKVILQISRSHG